jgi:hypothetical protein
LLLTNEYVPGTGGLPFGEVSSSEVSRTSVLSRRSKSTAARCEPSHFVQFGRCSKFSS